MVITRTAPAATRRPTLKSSHETHTDDWLRTYRQLLAFTDVVIISVVSIAGATLTYTFSGHRTTLTELPVPFGGMFLALSWILILQLSRSRDHHILGMGTDEYKRIARASFCLVALLAIGALVFDLRLEGLETALTIGTGMLLLLVARWLWRKRLGVLSQQGTYLARAIVLGNGDDIHFVGHQICNKNSPAFEVVAAIVPDQGTHPTNSSGHQENYDDVKPSRPLPGGHLDISEDKTIPVYHGMEEFPALIEEFDCSCVIVAGPIHGGASAVQKLAWQLEESDTDLILAMSLTNVAGPRISVRPVEGLPLMHVERPHFTGGRHIIKRSMDLVGSTVGTLLISPLLITLAIMVKLDSPGPVFFSQKRVGRDGETFGMLKFRTMVKDAEKIKVDLEDENDGSGPLFKLKSDPRVTKTGRWMRRFSLDELPQLLNVLLGHMSLVGPRPPLQSEVGEYEDEVHRRLLVKPGMTGLWQINGRSDLSWEETVRLDLYYVENWSITNDLMIMWRTIKAIRTGEGAY